MFNKKKNILLILFLFFLSFNLKAVDQFDFNLLSEKLNRLEQEISDVQKSLYAPSDNTLVKEDSAPVSSKYQIRINKLEPHNSVNLFLLTNVETTGKGKQAKVIPSWMNVSIATSSGSGFSTKVESNTITKTYMK